MTNLDEFFGDNQSQNVDALIAVTKKFFVFVSQLAEIVDDLERKYAELSSRISQISQQPSAPPQLSAPGLTSSPPDSQPIAPSVGPSPPTAPPPSLPTPPAFPTPPSPVQAQPSAVPTPVSANAPPQPAGSMPSPSSLPPLPGQSPAPPSPGLAPPTVGGQMGGARPPTPQAHPSPMSLKAQMNMELKEAFSRIRKGWDEEK